MNRSGQIDNYASGIFFIFLIAFSTLIGALIMTAIIDAYTNAGYYTGQLANAGAGFLRSILIMDYLLVLIVVAIIIAAGVTSFKINAPPIFFIVTIILGSFLAFMSWIFNYIFTQIISQPVFSTINASFPLTIRIATNLHWISLILIVVGSITLYAKKEQTGGAGFVE